MATTTGTSPDCKAVKRSGWAWVQSAPTVPQWVPRAVRTACGSASQPLSFHPLPNTLFERQTQKGSKMWRLWAKIQDRISRILKLATATIECPAMSFVFVTNENEKYKSVRRSSIWLSLGDDDQGPANTRYSTQTRNCLSYSNLARTKHYLDRVVSIINSRNFRILSTIQAWMSINYEEDTFSFF